MIPCLINSEKQELERFSKLLKVGEAAKALVKARSETRLNDFQAGCTPQELRSRQQIIFISCATSLEMVLTRSSVHGRPQADNATYPV